MKRGAGSKIPALLHSALMPAAFERGGADRKKGRYAFKRGGDAMAKVDWAALREQYIAGDMSYRDIAHEHAVGVRTVCKYAKEEGWAAARYLRRKQDAAESCIKLAPSADSDASAKRAIERMRGAADKMVEILDKTISDPERVNNTRAIKDLTAAMRDLTAVIRNLYDIPTLQEQAAMHIAAERLKLDQARLVNPEEEGFGGVIEIAEVVDG